MSDDVMFIKDTQSLLSDNAAMMAGDYGKYKALK